VIAYAAVSLIPLVWIILTSFRTPQDAIAYPPKVVAETSLVGYVNLFTTRSRVAAEDLARGPQERNRGQPDHALVSQPAPVDPTHPSSR